MRSIVVALLLGALLVNTSGIVAASGPIVAGCNTDDPWDAVACGRDIAQCIIDHMTTDCIPDVDLCGGIPTPVGCLDPIHGDPRRKLPSAVVMLLP